MAPVTAWATLVLTAHAWGGRLYGRDPASHIGFAPLVAFPRAYVPLSILVPAAMAVAAMAWGQRLAEVLPWRRLAAVAFVAAAAWAVALAVVDGPHGIVGPVRLANDYGRAVGMVTSPSAFLGGFVRGVNRLAFTQQVRGHPPGIVLALWALGRLGARGAWAEAAFFIACGAAMVPATLVALRDVAGEAAARTAAPFVALAPAALWIATTGDALIAGVAAWAVSLTVLATSRGGRHADVLAVAGGLLVGAALLASYAAPLFMLPAIAVAAQRRRARVLILAAAVALVVVALLRVGGFWWPDGLRATLRAYRLGVSQFRPQSYFWFGNLAAFALVVGPATAVALARLRDRRVWVLVVAALLALAVADATGLSKGEVERIWLPFAPWVMCAGAALRVRPSWKLGEARIALGANLIAALCIAALVHTTW